MSMEPIRFLCALAVWYFVSNHHDHATAVIAGVVVWFIWTLAADVETLVSHSDVQHREIYGLLKDVNALVGEPYVTVLRERDAALERLRFAEDELKGFRANADARRAAEPECVHATASGA